MWLSYLICMTGKWRKVIWNLRACVPTVKIVIWKSEIWKSEILKIRHCENLQFSGKLWKSENLEIEVCDKVLKGKSLLEAINKADTIILGTKWFMNTDFNKINLFMKKNSDAKLIYIDRIEQIFDPPTLFFKYGNTTT